MFNVTALPISFSVEVVEIEVIEAVDATMYGTVQQCIACSGFGMRGTSCSMHVVHVVLMATHDGRVLRQKRVFGGAATIWGL